MDTILLDLRYAMRAFVRAPGFVLAAVLTLGLGIGATTSIFSFVNGVVLRPLPYPSSERLVSFQSNVSVLNLRDLMEWSKSYGTGGGCVPQPLDWVSEREPVQLQAALVTGGLFHTLGVKPEVGRVLDEHDDQPGGARVVVVSHGFWQQRLGGDPEVIGRTLRLGGIAYSIVGVMPRGFVLPRTEAEVMAPISVVMPVVLQYRGINFLRTALRLAPGATLAQARQELVGIAKRLEQADPSENTGRSWVLMPLLERVVGQVRPMLLILFGAVTLVLLVACSNFANLLLTRAASRTHELAVRSSLGADRPRIVRQLVTESLLLAVAGGILGAVLSQWAVDLMKTLGPENLPRLADVRVDLRVLAFALGLSIVTGVVFGWVPALRAARGAEADALRRSGAAVTSPAGGQRLLGSLVVAQVALALVLLTGAGLLVKGFLRLRSVEPGFDPHAMLSMRLELPESRYPDLASQERFRAGVLEALRGLPGTQPAMVSELPLTDDALTHNFVIDGRPPIPVGQEPELYSRSVAGDYFRVMDIPIVAGRAFTPADAGGGPLVGVINQSMVKEYFKDQNPLGQRVRWARAEGEPQWITIVGVAGDVKHFGLDSGELSAIYTPYAQFGQDWKRWMNVVVRGRGDVATLTRPVKAAIASVDPEIPITKLRTMEEIVTTSLAGPRFQLTLLGTFATVALLLSAIGVFGVTAYAAGRRTRELGLRMALGATRTQVGWLVVRRGVTLAGLGILIGTAGALALTRFLSSMLYEVRPNDPVTLVAVAVTLGVVAAVACAIPGLRAARMEPLAALRSE